METNRLKWREGWPRRSAGYDYRDESAYPPIFSVNADISSQRLGANCRPEQVQRFRYSITSSAAPGTTIGSTLGKAEG